MNVEDFALYYTSLLTRDERAVFYSHAKMNEVVPCLDDEISMNEICEAVNDLKLGKAPGDDKVPMDFLKYTR